MNQPVVNNTATERERPRKFGRNKWSGPCIYKIREVKSPIQGIFRGYRILVAVPNMDGNRPFQSIPAASFMRSYLIFQTSDYTPEEILDKERAVVKELHRRGFTKVELSLEYEIRMLRQMGYLVDDEGKIQDPNVTTDEE